MNEIISIIRAKENKRSVMLKLSFIHGSTKPHKFNPNLVRETRHSDELVKNLNREGLWCTYY